MKGLFHVELSLALFLVCFYSEAAETVTVASYNVDNYRLNSTSRRKSRSNESRAVVAKAILAARPNIIGLQELGSREALDALRSELALRGLNYNHSAFLEAADQEIHCGVLSKFPIVENRSSSEHEFVLYGRVFRVLRGVMELKIELRSDVLLTLMNVHLKSKLSAWYADQADFRLAEAQLVRRRIEGLLGRDPDTNLIVLGDFNDHPNSQVIKTVRGKRRMRLFDLRPVEDWDSRGKGIAWTHYYESLDGYYRYDFILVSAALKKRWILHSAKVPRFLDWELASDHRLIQFSFKL